MLMLHTALRLHRWTQDQVRSVIAKMEAIHNFHVPANKKELTHF